MNTSQRRLSGIVFYHTAAAGVSERAIMDQTGHKSLTVLRRYIRKGSLFAARSSKVPAPPISRVMPA
ncbi:MAG: hypothetical protein HGA45_05040 [Chloroflexales bacterium]|nr:hypothetical protein [Chloroflexales bacterium]